MANRIGMFSEKAAERHGSVFWRHADGHEVEVTNVGDNADGYLWDDKVIVGEVTEYVRQGRKRSEHLDY